MKLFYIAVTGNSNKPVGVYHQDPPRMWFKKDGAVEALSTIKQELEKFGWKEFNLNQNGDYLEAWQKKCDSEPEGGYLCVEVASIETSDSLTIRMEKTL